jgi:hypothetical protein
MHTRSLSDSQGTGQEIVPTVIIMVLATPVVAAAVAAAVATEVATVVAMEAEVSASNAGRMVYTHTHKRTMLPLSHHIRGTLWLVLCTHALCLTPRALGKKLPNIPHGTQHLN